MALAAEHAIIGIVGLLKLMELAGFFTAHSVWLASSRQGPVVPILATEKAGERSLQRFDNEDSMEEAVNRAKSLLGENASGAECGIVIYDAFVTIDEHRSDALVVHGSEYGTRTVTLEIIQPYRPANADSGFAVMQPKVSLPDELVGSANALIEAFFRGLDSHEEGGPLWTQSLVAA